MRTLEQINKIKSRIIDPYCIDNFIDQADVDYLVHLYENTEKVKTRKNTGPVTLDINEFPNDPILKKVLEKIHKEIGDYKTTAGFFFWTNYPHIIHNDDTYELPKGVYRGITIPLKLYVPDVVDFPKLCFFDQFYFHGPTKFFKGETEVKTYYNKCLYDYTDVDGVSSEEFKDYNCKLLSHIKPRWLEGLSLHSLFEWKPTSAIIFDSVRLHCASDFRQIGISSKLGISIFTKVDV